jgi:hypothetical protein
MSLSIQRTRNAARIVPLSREGILNSPGVGMGNVCGARRMPHFPRLRDATDGCRGTSLRSLPCLGKTDVALRAWLRTVVAQSGTLRRRAQGGAS